MAEKDKWERLYTIPLSGVYKIGRHKLRSANAVAAVKGFVARHAGVEQSEVAVSEAINSHIWSFGGQRPPRTLKVKVIKEAGKAKATLLGEEETKKAADKKAEAKMAAKKKPEAKKEEKKAEQTKEEEAKPHIPKQKEESEEEKAEREKLEKIADNATMQRKKLEKIADKATM